MTLLGESFHGVGPGEPGGGVEAEVHSLIKIVVMWDNRCMKSQ